MFQQPFKSVIVGVDLSPYSKIVVKQARLLCRLWNAKLVLVYAMQDVVDYPTSPYVYFPNVINARTSLARIKAFYGAAGASAKFVAEIGAPVSLITETAKKYPNPMVMVGYKGHSKIAEFFFGSTAQQLALKSKLPVWIHRGNKVINPKKVLIPHDLSLPSSRSIDVVKKLSLASPTTYEVFHVNEKPFPILNYETFKKADRKMTKKTDTQVNSLLNEYPRIRVVKTDGNITDQVVKRSKDFDLLAMTHHNPKGLLSRSQTLELMKRVRTPLIIAH